MENCIIASKNSIGAITLYLDDGSPLSKLMVFPDKKTAEEELTVIKEESPVWADFEVFRIVPVSAKLCQC